MKKYFFIVIISVFLTIGIFLWYGIYSPKDLAGEEKIFSVEKGQDFFQVAENLEKNGLIKGDFYFKIYVLLQGYARSLQTGEYFLSPSMAIPEIVRKIISGDVAEITVTIPEGWTQKQIEERLGLVLPGENLEGFLFPDTYKFPINVDGETAVARMKENFDKKLTPDLKKEIERQGKTIFEIITMASMIQKEVRTLKDKKLVSGILWKRLEAGMPLQVDATLAYILGERDWGFKEMLVEIGRAKAIDSPYNTYMYLGLPAGPICNPGLESILAALYPENSEYWYYLSTPEGKTIFSKTLEEHNLARAKYLR